MKAAHEGVPVAGLPAGAWRSAEAPSSDAPLAPPLQSHRRPDGGRRTRRARPASQLPRLRRRPSRRSQEPPAPAERPAPPKTADLLPPAEIPNAGRGPVAHGKGLLGKLFRNAVRQATARSGMPRRGDGANLTLR